MPTGLSVARRDRAPLFFRKKVGKKLPAWISCYKGSASTCKPQDILCGIKRCTEGHCLPAVGRREAARNHGRSGTGLGGFGRVGRTGALQKRTVLTHQIGPSLCVRPERRRPRSCAVAPVRSRNDKHGTAEAPWALGCFQVPSPPGGEGGKGERKQKPTVGSS